MFDGISGRVFVLNPDSEVGHDLNPADKQFSYVIPVGGPGTTGISCGSWNFGSGIRGAHRQDMFGMQMAPMAKLLQSDQAVREVVAYINTFD